MLAVLLTGLLFTGCSKEQNVPAVMRRIDLSSTTMQLQMNVSKMNAKELQKKVEAYQAARKYQEDELKALGEKFRLLPADAMNGGEASRLQTQMALIENTLQAINERLLLYSKELDGKKIPEL
jgi:outer membrane murein-binding lipoprotein Lpp